NTESIPSPFQTIKNTSSFPLNIKNITYFLLDDEISSDVDDSESDRNEFIYNIHDLEKAISFKFRNKEIDNLVKFLITIKIEKDLVNEENLALELEQQIKDTFRTIIKAFFIPL
ncbi:23508_t:CDS:1, partial [Cetraspora pellucida]